ncbi:Ent-copalyl diphosphate synthase 1, chloroplastic [Ananas comosus]|uniref:Ent-copalyl diphosphate synthase 1, chloroplastic n=1 Tax=Ananas comosus TaxID=4615 RepID=A0A199V899_ANACO|nr:Ent-copalyl diphosphate synthase 1, chloroplastic [Ananas comosus]
MMYSGSAVLYPNPIPIPIPRVPGIDLWKTINEVTATLGAINDGEITISAYDTAWVALIEKQDGGSGPQFPSCVRWIVDNQLHDGSWGDAAMFSAHDRMINTLACVVALKLWGVHLEKYERGLSFLRENMWRLAEEEAELMTIGFEIAFPSLIEMAKNLGLDIPYDDPALKDIYARRSLKLKRYHFSLLLMYSIIIKGLIAPSTYSEVSFKVVGPK